MSSLLKAAAERDATARMQRRFFQGRVTAVDSINYVVQVDVGETLPDGTPQPLEWLPYDPHARPSIGDYVNLAYSTAQGMSAFVGSFALGQGNGDGSLGEANTVSSLQAQGASTALQGAVTLSASGEVTLTQAGQNIQISAPPAASPASTVTDVEPAGVVGVAATYAREDHAHRGVRSLQHAADGALYGDLQMQDSVNIGIATVGGGLKFTFGATRQVTTNTLLTMLDSTILAGASGITVSLPDATLNQAKLYLIKSGGVTDVTVSAASGQQIDAATSVTLAAAYAWLILQSDGVQWWILAQSPAANPAGTRKWAFASANDGTRYLIQATDCILQMTDHSTPVANSVEMPAAAAALTGQLWMIHAAGSHTVGVIAASGSLDGGSSISIASGHKRTLYCDGSNYWSVCDE
ncbi:MAG: hypothetical protein KGJ62_15430 [Armatimonadetes bacterium]|nr:hypothetical protein [Armatimonadota bacterium]MDE2207485.1 hypothetical protein [Armatimonadota bacterium]